ncbi:polyphosphate kinase 2 family protein [Neoroseomonas lacus]|uniref:Polyphosphate kinase-2-related domain-containing protein n=1 Tax=Neoroseomonas lacus TaxID=287609 RepID=A0A917NVN3_9PROT|nr:polyphosphate kinase 2 family protein [Neoroseomonas lacus]GGJ29441.1 hypothetical protein GCM10011320_40910 [Neoroseomonas lacus]
MMDKSVAKILDCFCVTSGKNFRLKKLDPADTAGLDVEKDHAADLLQQGVERLSELQDMLYAQDRWSVLCIFQAMDAAGKDGAIKHVFSGVNPQGCQVHSYKAPNAMELDHDFLWRHSTALPERGRIGIHNRSWYEEVLVVRVHPDYLGGGKLPQRLVGKRIWDERLEDIAAYERYLARQGTVVLKFFLNVSKSEQKRRFLSRIEEPEKNWKFSAADVAERAHWDDYMDAYEEAIRGTAARHAPWYVVPADNKWFTRLAVVAAIVRALEGLDLHYPKVTKEQKATLEVARKALV